MSDAVVALNLDDGSVRWHFQATAGDTFNSACPSSGPNCPKWRGPDFDFGAGVMLARNARGKDILLAGQKSGDVYALDPDDGGAVLWRTRVGSGSLLGGVHWGMTRIGDTLYAAANDFPFPIPGYRAKPGLYALDIDSGDIRWEYRVERGCKMTMHEYFGRSELYPDCSYFFTFSAALTSSNDLVFAPALDGKVRAFHADTGDVLWTYRTARSFQTTAGTKAHGGSMDNVGVQVAGEWAYMQSGYALFGQLPGNVLLAFRLGPT